VNSVRFRKNFWLSGRITGDADADLNAEDVVSCSAELRVLADVAVQIDVIDAAKVLVEMLPHAIEGDLVYEAVVAD